MRLIELHENSFDLKKFEEDCKPWLEATRGTKTYAFHGTKRGPADWEIWPMTHREKPRDSNKRLHDEANEFFKEKFGYPCRNWMFVTGGQNDAAVYGTPYAIFPIGQFKYLWNSNIYDLTNLQSTYSSDLWVNDASQSYDARTEKAVDLTMTNLKNSHSWKFDRDIKGALRSLYEIMIDCEKFYIMNAKNTYWDIVRPYLIDQGYLTDSLNTSHGDFV